MPVTQHVSQMIEVARLAVNQISALEAARLHEDGLARLVDIREDNELRIKGMIPEAIHAPRSMLEFWVDPESPYHKIVFTTDKQLILFCSSGQRSSLAAHTLLQMGLKNVANMEGGFTEWRMQDLPFERSF